MSWCGFCSIVSGWYELLNAVQNLRIVQRETIYNQVRNNQHFEEEFCFLILASNPSLQHFNKFI